MVFGKVTQEPTYPKRVGETQSDHGIAIKRIGMFTPFMK